LQDFLDLYYAGASVLLTEQDFFDLTWAYFLRCKENNIVHTEIMFDPQTHTERGVSFETVISGIQKARERAEKEMGISSFLIMSYLRHLSEDDAMRTLEASLPYKQYIKAVGLDSSERDNPPSKFERVFNASAKEGYILLAHAGEEGPAEYIWEALQKLHVSRIDHGNNCLSDPTLVQYLTEQDIPLTVCPLSNVALAVVKDISEHPIKKMLKLGLRVTVNSDDPAYFGGYLNDNFIAITEALQLTKSEIDKLIENGFKYSLH
jgi:adenosine deaminase